MPVLDQRECKVAVFVIAECTLEAGKQPTAKYQRETHREQCRRNPMAKTIVKIPHGCRRDGHFLKTRLKGVRDAYSTTGCSAIRLTLHWTLGT